ncbi:MAG: hypothetical protein V1921_01100 [Candidatus Altiarchaeota archaeon]
MKASRRRQQTQEELGSQKLPELLTYRGVGSVGEALKNPVIIGGLAVAGIALFPTNPIAAIIPIGMAAWGLKNR